MVPADILDGKESPFETRIRIRVVDTGSNNNHLPDAVKPINYTADGQMQDYKLIITSGDVEITGYDAIADLGAGFADNPTYVDAAAVIAALPTTVTISNSSDTVPVTWADTDSYDSATVDSYTFTGTVGTLPDGYVDDVDTISTVTVEVVLSAPLLAEKAFQSGADDETKVGDASIAALTEATMMAWVKPSATTNTIFALRDSTGTKASVHYRSNGTEATYFTNGGGTQWDTKSLTVSIPVNEWSHVALVAINSPGRTTEGVATLFVNGELSATWNYGLNGNSTSQNFAIGANGQGGDGGACTYDEVSLWGVALSEADIEHYMHTQPAVDATGLVLHWDFDSSDLTDSTGNGLNASSGTTAYVDSGAFINHDTNYVKSSYLWSSQDTGLELKGMKVTATSSIVGENVGILYGLKTADDVNGTTTDGVDSVSSTHRLLREWKMDEVHVDATGSISFRKDNFSVDDQSLADYQLLFRTSGVSPSSPFMMRGGSGDFSEAGIEPTEDGEFITFSGVSFANGFYTLGSTTTLTPAIGLEVSLSGTELVWTVEDEVSVQAYEVTYTLNGETKTQTVIADNSDFYTVDLPEGATDVKLVVVDKSGYRDTNLPEDGNIKIEVYDLEEGWNLIAITSDDADLETLKDETVGVLWGWIGSGYEVIETAKATDAVWVYAPIAKQVYVSGTKSDAQIDLSIGWNMVGPVENDYIPEDADTVYSWSKVYDVIAGEDKVLIGGKGYWIFSL